MIRDKDRGLYEIMNAIEKMGYSETLAGRLRELEAQKAAAQRERQTLAAPHLIDLSNLEVPSDMDVVHAMLQTEQGRAALRDVLERLLTHVEVVPPSWNLAVGDSADWSVVLHGNLPALDANWAATDAMAEAAEEGLTAEERAEMQAYNDACAAEEA